MWIKQCFIITDDEILNTYVNLSEELMVSFSSVTDSLPLIIHMSSMKEGKVKTKENNYLADNLYWKHGAGWRTSSGFRQLLKSKWISYPGIFPKWNGDFEGSTEKCSLISEYLNQIEEHQSVRTQLSASIAEIVNAVKVSVIRAEDSRVLGDM